MFDSFPSFLVNFSHCTSNDLDHQYTVGESSLLLVVEFSDCEQSDNSVVMVDFDVFSPELFLSTETTSAQTDEISIHSIDFLTLQSKILHSTPIKTKNNKKVDLKGSRPLTNKVC